MIFVDRRQTWLAAAFYILLAVIFTWPLAANLSHSVVGWPGDNYYFVWLIGWFQKALGEHVSLLVVPQLNYPQGWNLAYNEITPAMVLLALPGSWLGGPVLGYNTSILLSFVLSGLGLFWWVRRLTGNFLAGLLAGTAFAFAPYRMAHLLGHLNLMGTHWLPLYFMTFTDLLQGRQKSWRGLGLPLIFLALIAATSQYYLYMTLLLSLAYAAGYLILTVVCTVDRQERINRLFWKRLILFSLIALPLIVLIELPYLRLAAQDQLPPRNWQETRPWSAGPTDFLTPSVQHFAWGAWVKAHFDRESWVEKDIYIGVVTLALAVYALFARPGDLNRTGVLNRTASHKRLVMLLALLGLVSFILALGTDLHWAGQTVHIPTPAFFHTWRAAPKMPIPLPGYLLFKILPFYSLMRVWMRYAIFVQLFAGLLAGLGLAFLMNGRSLPLRRLAGIALLALLILDFLPGNLPFTEISARPVDEWLAQQPGQGAVAQFPFQESIQPPHTYYTLIHNKPFIGGFFAAGTTPQYRRIQSILEAFPDAAGLALLGELGVEWIIVDIAQYPDSTLLYANIESLGLKKLIELDGQAVYQLPSH